MSENDGSRLAYSVTFLYDHLKKRRSGGSLFTCCFCQVVIIPGLAISHSDFSVWAFIHSIVSYPLLEREATRQGD